MPKFIKKPVVVEAIQWDGTAATFKKITDMIGSGWRPGSIGTDSFYVETLEGEHIASKGDYIIKGVAGEFYPCKPEIFNDTYDPVEDSIDSLE